MASKWVKMKFLELGVNRKVVGNVENYLNMKFQPKKAKHSVVECVCAAPASAG